MRITAFKISCSLWHSILWHTEWCPHPLTLSLFSSHVLSVIFSNLLPLVSKSWWTKKGCIVTQCRKLWLHNQFMSWFIRSLESVIGLIKLQHTDTVWKSSSEDPTSWLSLFAGRHGAGHEDPLLVFVLWTDRAFCLRERCRATCQASNYLSRDYLI